MLNIFCIITSITFLGLDFVEIYAKPLNSSETIHEMLRTDALNFYTWINILSLTDPIFKDNSELTLHKIECQKSF